MAEDDQVTELKLELKEWENTWAAEHDGRKPSREDIKANPEIAAKYKAYSKLRKASSSSSLPTEPPARSNPLKTPTKQPAPPPKYQTPTKQLRTPSKRLSQTPTHLRTPSDYDSPLTIHRLRLGRAPNTIDPTPQKNGTVLGLLESLAAENSPLRPRLQTIPESPLSQKTKASTSRTLLDSPSRPPLSTPRKRKLTDLSTSANTPLKPTASTIMETPSYLRTRAPPPSLLTSPPPLFPLTRKPHTKSLTTMVSELRALATHSSDDDFSDEEAALREMEGLPPAPKTPSTGPIDFKALLAKRAKPAPPPPGVDLCESVPAELEEENFDGVEGLGDKDAYGNPRVVWKKKGLKRQTKRVRMKPTPVVRSERTPSVSGSEDEEEGGEGGKEGDEGETDGEGAEKKRKGKGGKVEEVKKKPARKVNELAHANFQRLNLRGRRGRGRGGGRFGRR